MGRKCRLLLAGCPAHVVHRGNNGDVVFHCESDYRYYWRCLKEAVDEIRVEVNAYVFMNNHVHLLMTPETSTGISDALHAASGRYSKYYNRIRGRQGTLWQSRFFASPVDTDEYLLTCHRYIDLNPVRANLVPSPELYDWSSHRYFALGERNPLVTPHRYILSRARGKGLEHFYRALFQDPLEPVHLHAIRAAVIGGRPIGVPPAKAGRPKKIGA
jgi:putative transposase